MHKPTKGHMNIAKGVLRYLKGSIDYKLNFVKGEDLHVTGFVDSDHASDPIDRISFTGYCFRLNPSSALVSWRTCKQPHPTDSTTEAEYIALWESMKEALF